MPNLEGRGFSPINSRVEDLRKRFNALQMALEDTARSVAGPARPTKESLKDPQWQRKILTGAQYFKNQFREMAQQVDWAGLTEMLRTSDLGPLEKAIFYQARGIIPLEEEVW